MLRRLADSLWIGDMPHSVMGFQFGGRMMITRASDGSLTMISPIHLDESMAREIRALGPVRYLVAPNKMHYRFIPEAKATFPKATVLAAPGLKEKRPELPIDGVIGSSPEHERAMELEWLPILGMPMFGDVAFFQRSTRTVFVADLFANFPTHPHWWTRTYLKLSGVYGRPGQTLLLKMSTKDRPALLKSRNEMLKWDFDRLIVAHGDVIETGGKEALKIAIA